MGGQRSKKPDEDRGMAQYIEDWDERWGHDVDNGKSKGKVESMTKVYTCIRNDIMKGRPSFENFFHSEAIGTYPLYCD